MYVYFQYIFLYVSQNLLFLNADVAHFLLFSPNHLGLSIDAS